MQIEVTDGFPSMLDDIAAQADGATFYHTSTWIESLRRVYPAMQCRCIIARAAGDIVGYLPFFVVTRRRMVRLWSQPFGTYGGPVALNGEAGGLLVDAYAAMRENKRVHEVGLVAYADGYVPSYFASEEARTHLLLLTADFNDIWENRFDKSKRRQTRKAQREGIEVTEARTSEDIAEHYRIYAAKSREWRQSVVYPHELFTELFDRGGDRVRLFLARSGDKVVGGHLNFYYKDTVVAWNGVTTGDSRGMQASTMLYATCIRDACERGYKHYNLGASLGKTSLMEYKESLGGVPYIYRVARWRSTPVRVAAGLRRLIRRS